ncbi:MAG TPA: S8 family serine peptidase [Solimonas sp.]|nr:S8 family serine peptidase [Solimonas sp.]
MDKRQAVRSRAAAVLALLLAGCSSSQIPGAQDPRAAEAPAQAAPGAQPRVVAATYDTGTNPFHPCFRRPAGPSTFDAIPELRGIAEPLKLTFKDDYASSLAASHAALDRMAPFTLYAVEGTNLLIYTGPSGGADLIDTYPHGSQASSQIACPEYGMAPDGFLVVVNWYANTGVPQQDLELWGAQQEWIDVIHLNIQRITPWPVPSTTQASIQAMVDAGKMVVIAAGNGWGNAAGHIPTETVDFYSIPGILAAGANDGVDYASFSNLDPHVVMDGCGTEAAEPAGFGTSEFSGTSSSSPRITGYVMQLLRLVRMHYGSGGGTAGAALVRLEPGQRPATGPLADGLLTVPELHEVLRKTADPTLAASWLDGASCLFWLPRLVDPQGHDYHRIGYGKLSEHTIGHALAVLTGAEPMPERSTEDMYYMLSTTLRDNLW